VHLRTVLQVTHEDAGVSAPAPETPKNPPAWFSVTAVLGLVLAMGSAFGAGVLAAEPMPGRAQIPLPAPVPDRPTAPSVVGATLPGGACPDCGRPGTTCEASICRLAAGARWTMRPFALLLDARLFPLGSRAAVCLNGASANGWVCSREVVGTPSNGRLAFYFPDATRGLPTTTEDIERRGVNLQIRVNGVAQTASWRTPAGRVIASQLLFDGGLKYRDLAWPGTEAIVHLEANRDGSL
jgi:hypothetical protein